MASEVEELFAQMTREQRAVMAHMIRLMLMRKEITAEIDAMQEAIEEGHLPGVPTVH